MPDVLNLLRSFHVDFVTSGKNVKRGNANVKCPMCGHADPSYHLGIDLKTGYWGCWRNVDHRGKSLDTLLPALLHISITEARNLCQSDALPEGTWADLRLRSNRLLRPQEKGLSPPPDPVVFPADFDRVSGKSSISRRFWEYLERDRGFGEQTQRLVNQYDLRYSLEGRWSHRIILPIFVDGQLKGWQGRSIAASHLRYLSYPNSDAIKRLLFNQDVSGGEVLVIVEGPVDSLKVDLGGRDRGIRAVATLGTSFLEAQVSILLRLSQYFKKTLILFDPGAAVASLRLAQQLAVVRPVLGRPMVGVEDPGALPLEAVPDAIFSQL